MKADCEEVIYVINPKSSDTKETLKLYEFAGRVVGKAIFERITLDIHFDDCLLKALSEKQITLDDLKSIDSPVTTQFASLYLTSRYLTSHLVV